MRNLIAVDDRKIRKTAFLQLDRLLKKLQRMESNMESFYDRDQRLFNEWFELTFRGRRQNLESLRAEYRDLAEFHNWMLAMAAMEDLSLPQAIVLLREEEDRFRRGTTADRQEITELRRLREAYVRAESERRQRRAEQRRSREEQEFERAHPTAPDPEDLDELEIMAAMPNEEIAEWCEDDDVAFLLLGKTLRVGGLTEDFDLFFRLWDLIHPKIQRQFAREFEKSSGVSLFDAIERMRAKFGQDAPAEPAPAPIDPNETLKLVYRQLARKLHPDMNGGDTGNGDWRHKMWLRVQAAYREKDSNELGKLLHLVLLRGRELNDLRISELHLSRQWLEDEIHQTQGYLANLRRQPAWGFSRRKDLSGVERKLDRQLAKERQLVEDQVIELRTHHAFLERMGRAEGQPNNKGLKRRRPAQRST